MDVKTLIIRDAMDAIRHLASLVNHVSGELPDLALNEADDALSSVESVKRQLLTVLKEA